MRESKIPVWLIPLILVAGIFLGRLGWKVDRVSIPPVEVAPPENSPTSLVQVSATVTPRPTIPATVVVVQPQSRVQLVEVEKTGASTRQVYDVSLASDEVIVGNAYDFQDKGYNCVAFIIRGPGTFQFSVLDGAWYRYSGVKTDMQAEELLQGQVQYLQNHWFCKNVSFPVERIGK